ncbi:hypothetical protein [Endozoicomonas sp. Mp262]|uniref:hypothetical protein n=1 Tax=Endozoicomonas sp. Mp262 TaxID=2919499 RepID=UPI0021D9CB43
MWESKVSAFYYDEKGKKISFSTNELYLVLDNGQVLTVSKSHNTDGVSISDHSLIHSNNHKEHKEFAVFSITPSACNVIVLDSQKHVVKSND